jgi:hypothetical protein
MQDRSSTTTTYFLSTLFLAAACLSGSKGNAQNVAINPAGTPPADVAVLDLKDNPDTGLLIPRIALQATNVEAPVVAPAPGLLVYNTATTAYTGVNAQFNVTPGFYIWDTGLRWTRFEALVRRPQMLSTVSASLVTTSGPTWVTVTGLVSQAMPLMEGDRVDLRAHGTVSVSGNGDAEGALMFAVSVNGGPYTSLPNGSGTTVYAVDNGNQTFGGTNTVAKRTPTRNWKLSGFYEVPANAPGTTYAFAVMVRRTSGTAEVTTGGAATPANMVIEVVRP